MPVITVRRPTGTRTSRFLRLLARAPLTTSQSSALFFAGSLRLDPRRGWTNGCANASRVGDSNPISDLRPPTSPENRVFGSPCHTTRRRIARPGTRSMRWSARRMVSSSCSTTTRELPFFTQSHEGLEELRVVARVEADGGLVEDVEDATQVRASWAARRMRWLSPPLRVVADRSSCR